MDVATKRSAAVAPSRPDYYAITHTLPHCYSMYKLSWILKNNQKLKADFFSRLRVNISANQMISDDNKDVNNRNVQFGSVTR